MKNVGDSISGAIFSDDGCFRYSLWRVWDKELPMLIFTGLNPSKAGKVKNDPTVIRMIGFGKVWGFGGLFMSNLHPFITPYPEELWSNRPPEQDDLNDEFIIEMRRLSAKSMVGWGNEGVHAGDRPAQVLELLGKPVYCLRINRSGEPIHPLYLPRTSQLVPYVREK